MPKIQYIRKRFSKSSLNIINQANNIIVEYEEQGFSLTLRQLYYQFVSRDFIANKQTEYKRIGSIVNDARLAGLIDWYSIEDRTRNLEALSHWCNPSDIVQTCINQYRIDKWENQKYWLEVWIEKDALTGIIQDICHKHDVPYFSCRGYTSQSEMWTASQRLLHHAQENDQIPVIIHLGDHDPSGIDMTRDIMDRLNLFSLDFRGEGARVKRIALNMDQVEQYKPSPNPAKTTDSRYQAYIMEYGGDSWELDALEPGVIVGLIDKTINKLLMCLGDSGYTCIGPQIQNDTIVFDELTDSSQLPWGVQDQQQRERLASRRRVT